MEKIFFGLVGLTSYYPFYMLNRNGEVKKIDKITYNIHPNQLPLPEGSIIKIPTDDNTVSSSFSNYKDLETYNNKSNNYNVINKFNTFIDYNENISNEY